MSTKEWEAGNATPMRPRPFRLLIAGFTLALWGGLGYDQADDWTPPIAVQYLLQLYVSSAPP